MELTKRQKDILFAIIEEYAEVATPVGSVTLAKLFDVSSATIRAEMGRLEELGLITHPHTSAGRIPTDAGYRLYVNSQMENTDNPSERIPHELPTGESAGERLVNPARLLQDPFLEKIDRLFNARVVSQNKADIAIRGAVDSLVELTGNLGLATIGSQLYLAGISHLFMQPEFLNHERVQAVAKLLDNLEPWLRETAPGEPLNIFIGSENPIGKSAEMSLIISKFHSPFLDNSYIGVLGPTRQNYSRVMALVRRAGEMLEDNL